MSVSRLGASATTLKVWPLVYLATTLSPNPNVINYIYHLRWTPRVPTRTATTTTNAQTYSLPAVQPNTAAWVVLAHTPRTRPTRISSTWDMRFPVSIGFTLTPMRFQHLQRSSNNGKLHMV